MPSPCARGGRKPIQPKPPGGRFAPAVFRFGLAALLVAELASTGCFVATQSFNHGKVLKPGEGMLTIGLGRRRYHILDEHWESEEVVVFDTVSTDPMVIDTGYTWSEYSVPDDTSLSTKFCGSFNYRLGFLDRYPFGKGTELGFHVEIPSQSYSFYGLPLLEFEARCGLTGFVLFEGVFHHNVSAGWAVGGWVDNGWFAGYTASVERTHFISYLNTRLQLQATDFTKYEFVDREDFLDRHDRIFNIRHAAGISLKLPRMVVLPDYITPELSIVYPHYSALRHVGFAFHVGFRWLNGI